MYRRLVAASFAAVVLAGGLVGCGNDGPEPTSESGPRDRSGPPASDSFEAATELLIPVPERYERGKTVAASTGCLACHTFGAQGNRGPGPDLTRVGARMSTRALTRALIDPRAPMPSFAALREKRPRDFRELVAFLAALK